MSRRIRSPDPLSAAYSEDNSSIYDDSEHEHERLFTRASRRHHYYFDVEDSEDDGFIHSRQPLNPRRSPNYSPPRNVLSHASLLSGGEDGDFRERSSREEDRILERVAREEARRELERKMEKDEVYSRNQRYDSSPRHWQRDRETDRGIADGSDLRGGYSVDEDPILRPIQREPSLPRGDDLPRYDFQQRDPPLRHRYHDDIAEDDPEMARPRREHRRSRPVERDALQEEADLEQLRLQRGTESSSSSTEDGEEILRYHRLHQHRPHSEAAVFDESIPHLAREKSSSRQDDRGHVMGVYKHQYSSSPREEVYEVIIRQKGRPRPSLERGKEKDLSAGRPVPRGRQEDDLEEIIVWLDHSRRERSRLPEDREGVDHRNIGGIKESHLPAAETKEEIKISRLASGPQELKEEIHIIEERRPSGSHAGRTEGKRKPVCTEVSKDLIVRKAIERAGYEYEEKSDFYRIFEYLRHVCSCRFGALEPGLSVLTMCGRRTLNVSLIYPTKSAERVSLGCVPEILPSRNSRDIDLSPKLLSLRRSIRSSGFRQSMRDGRMAVNGSGWWSLKQVQVDGSIEK